MALRVKEKEDYQTRLKMMKESEEKEKLSHMVKKGNELEIKVNIGVDKGGPEFYREKLLREDEAIVQKSEPNRLRLIFE